MPWRGPSAISTTRKWRRSARRRRGERADDAQSRRHRGAGGRRRAWRLRRRGARRSEAGACAADEGRARARRAAAAGQALRAGALHGGGADRPVPSRAHRRRRDQPEGAGPGQRRGMGRAHQRAATGGGQTMNTKTMKAVYGFAWWLAGIGLALAQSNSIESFEVSQQAGKTIVRITTKVP